MCRRNRVLLVVAAALSLGLGAETADAASVQHGRQVFGQCAPCHATDKSTRVGPGLGGIVGRRSGAMPGFHYSRAMKRANIIWDNQTLDAYIGDPQKEVPGNLMPFSGIADAKDRADLIAYLDTLK